MTNKPINPYFTTLTEMLLEEAHRGDDCQRCGVKDECLKWWDKDACQDVDYMKLKKFERLTREFVEIKGGR